MLSGFEVYHRWVPLKDVMFKTRYPRRLLMSIQDSGTKHTLRSGFAKGETLL